MLEILFDSSDFMDSLYDRMSYDIIDGDDFIVDHIEILGEDE